MRVDSGAFESRSADLVVTTRNAAQVFLADEEWAGVLTNSFRALVPGGFLAFESRNPRIRSWEQWNKEDSIASYQLPNSETFHSWVCVTQELAGLVTFVAHTVFDESDCELTAASTQRFSNRSTLDKSCWQQDSWFTRSSDLGTDSRSARKAGS